MHTKKRAFPVIHSDADHQEFMRKLRERLDNVGVELPKVEVRFQNLQLGASVYTRSSRAISSIPNSFINTVQSLLSYLHVLPSNKKPVNILHNVSGVVRPSRLTLLLGPPASGKTTLLRALANKFGSEVHGEVTYNGLTFHEFPDRKYIAYVSQEDLHLSELTVRETLNFSAQCQGVGHQKAVLNQVESRERVTGLVPDPDVDAFMREAAVDGRSTSIMTEYIVQVLGLEMCADTIVGNALQRGISGGQKKRLTSGEILVGPASILFMDEISTGLDSSTTSRIIKRLQHTVRALDKTILISLLQPPPEVFELFDDLILLAEGHIIYQGPRDRVLLFLEAQGFKCPERKGVADFLQEVVSMKDQPKYWIRTREAYRYISGKDFAAAFESYRLEEFLLESGKKLRVQPPTEEDRGLSNWKLMKACMAREIILIKRNLPVHIANNIVQGTIIALIISTIFLRTTMPDKTIQDANKYMGVLFYMVMNVMFRGLPEMTLTVTRLPAFYKQRELQFYPAWAWAIPTIFFRIPLSALDVGIWTCITYWCVGFAPEFVRFLKQFLLLFALNQSSVAMFRCIGSICRSPTMTGTFGFMFFISTVANGGYLKSRENIQSWWIWSYWTSPYMYGQNAIAVNEFYAKRWQKPAPGSSDTIGELLLKERGMFAREDWYWIGIAGLVVASLVFNIIYILALTFLKPLGKSFSSYSLEELPAEQPAKGTGVDVENGRKAPVKEIEFPSLSLAFSDINYYVDLPPAMKQEEMKSGGRLQLLNRVSGALRPGVLTALIGETGAGKTTLFDVLAGRKTIGKIEGSISVNGYPKNQKTFARVSGYCEQIDIHSAHLTVYESLVFSAWLRLPTGVNDEITTSFIEEVMELVELTPIRNVSVGVPNESGLSTEQRKRLTIAVELVANPSILFIDEPTSGLDARAAAIVMRAIRNTVNTSRTVVCTIHQPSIDIFESFDELLLMKRGGRLIYAGPLGKESCHLVDYFQAVPGIPRIKPGQNPATWIMEATNQSVEQLLGLDLAKVYEESPLYERNQELIKEISAPATNCEDLHFATRYSKPFLEQFRACLWKQYQSYWRNPVYFYSRMFYGVVVAFFVGTMFWKAGKQLTDEQDVFNLLGAIYTSTIYVGISDAISVQPYVLRERTVFYRENAAGMYSALPFALAQVIVEVPYIFLQATAHGLLFYIFVGLEWTVVKFFYLIFFMFGSCLNYTMFGMLGVAMTPNLQMAVLTHGALIPWNIFSGIILPLPKIPPWWKWCSWLCPPTWSLYGLLTSQIGDETKVIQVPGESPQTVKQFILSYFGYESDNLQSVVLMHFVFPVVFALGFAGCIAFARFQHR